MDSIKVFFASILWLISLRVFRNYNPNFSSSVIFYEYINWFIGLASILATLMIVFGIVGYYWNNYKNNKEKKYKFKEALICGIIILITAMISYAMIIVL